MKSYDEVFSDVTKTAIKIPQSDYLTEGKYRIFDQGKDYSFGFSNEEHGVVTDYPYIIFGDHTRVVKYVKEPCFIGADGVKLLKVTNEIFIPKFVYYSMIANPVESQGYSRHFKLLKDSNIKYDREHFALQNTVKNFDNPIISMPDGIVKARIYIWIEGQDIDIIKHKSEDDTVSVTLNFVKDHASLN
jgi:type I restriction enzyme S subunit